MEKLYPRQSEIIRTGRLRSGYSQQQVSFILGVQLRQYQRLEYGERSIAKVNMQLGLSLCHVLEIDPFLLLFTAMEESGEQLDFSLPNEKNRKNSGFRYGP